MVTSQFVSNPIFYKESTTDIMISKSNTLIEAGFELTLAEHNLLTLAINKLHKQGTNNNDVFITAKEFAVANKISESHAYQQLKETANNLMNRKIKFPLFIDLQKKSNNEPNVIGVLPPKNSPYEIALAKYNWLQGVAYVDAQGFIYLHFSDPLRFLIDKTGDAYTNYNYSNTLDMTSFNAKRLYELVCKWKDLGSTKSMYIDDWKEFFGVLNKYPKIAEFKRWVLIPAIEAINNQGDFTLTLKQEKVGRNITHFQILIKKNSDTQKIIKTMKTKNNSEDNPQKVLDMLKEDYSKSNFIQMTEAQLNTFSSKLSTLPDIQKMAHIGEEMKEFIWRLRGMLTNPEQQQKLRLYLEQVGFKTNNK